MHIPLPLDNCCSPISFSCIFRPQAHLIFIYNAPGIHRFPALLERSPKSFSPPHFFPSTFPKHPDRCDGESEHPFPWASELLSARAWIRLNDIRYLPVLTIGKSPPRMPPRYLVASDKIKEQQRVILFPFSATPASLPGPIALTTRSSSSAVFIRQPEQSNQCKTF